MPSQFDPTEPEARLLGELRGMFERADPVPEHVLSAAHAAIELRDLDAQLAELLRDSAVDETDKELAGVRGTATRLLTFSVGAERYVEVDVENDGNLRTLAGYVVPGAAGELVVEHRDGQLVAEIDEHGRFSVERVESGPVRLRVSLDGEQPIVTQWTLV